MGITPTLPMALERMERPDVVHVLGFRDPVSTGVAVGARVRRIPYVFEPLGMFEPRLRKVALKRALDATLYRGVAGGAAAVVVSSEREAEHVRAGGVPAGRVRVGQRLPDPDSMPPARGVLRVELAIPDGRRSCSTWGASPQARASSTCSPRFASSGMHTSCSSGRTTATAPSAGAHGAT